MQTRITQDVCKGRDHPAFSPQLGKCVNTKVPKEGSGGNRKA